MTEPLVIIRAKFLHYESITESTEMMAKAIMYKKNNANTTRVLMGLYTRGFYITGKLNHVSGEEDKSKQNLFVCAGLLKNVYKLQFREDFVLWVFHETVELKIEALLFLFPNKSGSQCFFKYLKKLISDKFCSGAAFASFQDENDSHSVASTKRSTSTIQSLVSKRSKASQKRKRRRDKAALLFEEKENEQKWFVVNQSREKLQFSGYSKNINIGNYDIEDVSDAETILSLNSSLIKNYFHGEQEIFVEDVDDLAYQACNDEYTFVTDSETDQSVDSFFWKTNPNMYNQTLEGIEMKEYLNGPNLEICSEIHNESDRLDDRKSFCWPDYLVPELKIQSSFIVEMSFAINNKTNNWSLWDKFITSSPLAGWSDWPELEWEEHISRIHYDPIRRILEPDDDGSLLIYCCRQRTKQEDVESVY